MPRPRISAEEADARRKDRRDPHQCEGDVGEWCYGCRNKKAIRDDLNSIRRPTMTATIEIEVGQIWRDADGQHWHVAELDDETHVHVGRAYPRRADDYDHRTGPYILVEATEWIGSSRFDDPKRMRLIRQA